MTDKNIAFIGAGHIGQALADGLVTAKAISAKNLILANPRLDCLYRFIDKSIQVTTDNVEAVKGADVIFITVRPKVVKIVVEQINNYVKKDSIIISVAAGVTFDLLHKYFSAKDIKMVRIMPNIPVAYGLGVVGWVGENLTANDKILIKSLLKPLGLVIECKDEKTLDKLSMISGCGIGYVAYFMNNLEKITKSYGFSEDETRRIVNQVFSGTNRHLEVIHESPEELIKAVATKGGITEEVIDSLDTGEFQHLLSESIKKGYDKMGKLTEELNQIFNV